MNTDNLEPVSPGHRAKRAPTFFACRFAIKPCAGPARAGRATVRAAADRVAFRPPARTANALRARGAGDCRSLLQSVVSAVSVAVLTAVAIAPTGSIAGTLGRVGAIERNPNALIIDGRKYRVAAESTLTAAEKDGSAAAVITMRSIRVGDYVVYESDDSVIKSLQRVSPSNIDMPPAVPLPLQPGRSSQSGQGR